MYKNATRIKFGGISVILAWVLINIGHAIGILFYVRGGTLPNNYTAVTEPHSAWKPYSVFGLYTQPMFSFADTCIAVYIIGYLVSVLNMFVFAAFFDFYEKWSSSPLSDNEKRSSPPPVFQALCLTVSIPIAIFCCVSPLFAPYLGLPLRQQVKIPLWIFTSHSPFI